MRFATSSRRALMLCVLTSTLILFGGLVGQGATATPLLHPGIAYTKLVHPLPELICVGDTLSVTLLVLSSATDFPIMGARLVTTALAVPPLGLVQLSESVVQGGLVQITYRAEQPGLEMLMFEVFGDNGVLGLAGALEFAISACDYTASIVARTAGEIEGRSGVYYLTGTADLRLPTGPAEAVTTTGQIRSWLTLPPSDACATRSSAEVHFEVTAQVAEENGADPAGDLLRLELYLPTPTEGEAACLPIHAALTQLKVHLLRTGGMSPFQIGPTSGLIYLTRSGR